MGRVFVAGSINMDVVAVADRHPKAGETVTGREVLYFPGGKGSNQAVAAAKLGAKTSLIGRTGDDAFGLELRAFLSAQDIDLSFVREISGAHSGTALITIANAENTIVVIPGANGLLSVADVEEPTLASGDVAVSQFEIPLPAISAFFTRARAVGATTILNLAPAIAFDREILELVDILVLNETELGFLAGSEMQGHEARVIDAARSLQCYARKTICVTLGRRGAIALVGSEVSVIPGHIVNAVDTTGAGDCFVGVVAAQLAKGQPVRDALEYANAAASICVQRIGAGPSMPTTSEVEACVSRPRRAGGVVG